MGKRSRKRSGPQPKAATPSAAAPATARGAVERARISWRVAAEAGPKVVKEPGRKTRIQHSGGRPRPQRGDRPTALWGRAPISEFAVAAGLIVLLVGLVRGPDRGQVAITTGLVLITIAALEFAGREHLRGYRSHSLFLAMLVVIAVHFGLAFAIGAHTARSPVFIALDVVLFGLVATTLSKQYSIVRAHAAHSRSR
jgi:hypothetical protein